MKHYIVTVAEYLRVKNFSTPDSTSVRTATQLHVLVHSEGETQINPGDRFFLLTSRRGSGR